MAQKTKIDFDDEDAVLAAVCKDLDEDPDDWTIDEEKGLTSFGEGTVYEIECGRRSYCVVEDHDVARALAIAVVTQDLEEDPGMFIPRFIEGHINQEKLRRELERDVLSMNMDRCEEMRDREFWEEAERFGIDKPEADEDDEDAEEDPEPSDDAVEELAEAVTKAELKDPMQYLEDIYGDESVKKAIEIAGIDVEAAAEEAVDSDGIGHFLSHYDGNTMETPSGLVYWRTN